MQKKLNGFRATKSKKIVGNSIMKPIFLFDALTPETDFKPTNSRGNTKNNCKPINSIKRLLIGTDFFIGIN